MKLLVLGFVVIYPDVFYCYNWRFGSRNLVTFQLRNISGRKLKVRPEKFSVKGRDIFRTFLRDRISIRSEM